MTSRAIHVEIGHHLAIVTLDCVSSEGGINERTAWELRDACARIAREDDIWVVVLTGKDDTFCRGTDVSALRASDSVLTSIRSLKVADSVAALEKPVIVALNGDALDQGLELALACDIRVASTEAVFGLTQVKQGLMPWDGGTQRLPRLIGGGRATELILTSRTITAQQALDIGLVNQVVESGKVAHRAREIASAIAQHGPIAATYLKEAVLKGLDMTLEQGLRLEADLNFILQSTSDRAEGIRSFLERRKPEYQGE